MDLPDPFGPASTTRFGGLNLAGTAFGYRFLRNPDSELLYTDEALPLFILDDVASPIRRGFDGGIEIVIKIVRCAVGKASIYWIAPSSSKSGNSSKYRLNASFVGVFRSVMISAPQPLQVYPPQALP